MRSREHTYLLTKRIHTLAETFDEIVTRSVHARKETVNAQVFRRLQSRDEEIVLSTRLIKLVHLHKTFIMLTFRSSARTSFQGRGGRTSLFGLNGYAHLCVVGRLGRGKK